MAAELRSFRPQLIQRCSEALIKGLVDDLLHLKILTDAEVESIIQGNTLRADKCRLLIDTVIRKGDYSCKLLLQKIKAKDPILSEDLRITVAGPISNMGLQNPSPGFIVVGAGTYLNMNSPSSKNIVAGPGSTMNFN